MSLNFRYEYTFLEIYNKFSARHIMYGSSAHERKVAEWDDVAGWLAEGRLVLSSRGLLSG